MELPTILENESIKKAMEVINKYGLGIVFVVDNEEKLVGVATDGDIRRAILSGVSVNTPVSKIMNKDPVKIYENWDENKIREYLHSPKIRIKIPKFKSLIIPVLSEDNKITGIRAIYRDIENNKYILKYPQDVPNIKKVLVIGGAGYIGSVLVRMLLKKGYHVKVMDNLLYGDEGIKDLYNTDNFEFFKGSITNISDVVEAMKDVDAVIHLAAIVGDPASKLKPKETLEINYFSAKMLGEVAKFLGISKFIFASTCSVYGFREDVCTEESELNPLSLYAETKLMSEKALLELRGNGFCPVILRFATAYGLSPRMRFDLVVNLLIAKALIDREITIFGEGKQYRPFVHIKDISRAIIKVLEAPMEKICGEVFNVGSDEQNMSIKELAERIKSKVPEAELKFIKEKEDNRSYKVSFRKIKEKLGFSAKYTIENAIEEIRKAFDEGKIKDFRDKKYSNHRSLEDTV